ncbi:Fur family transcriptional regulator [Oscillibacter sp.]|uniref:Fur family transcriptional regulator n=1 Tax=Oscillibacter sp. TaxID=1945593 RepID=UPI0026347570|nr:transcriptional repressor [Oscillibacter sp.]MDD3347872.1 transcriptional repressor [Oscillibacter sp.]
MKVQRNTRQRQLVLDAVRARRDHPTADQIYLDVRALDEKISRGTVYRNLNVLTALGEVLQVKVPTADRFDLRLELHYHLLCTGCGTVCDVALPYHSELDRELAETTGYEIERHRTVFEGLCPDCRNNL